MDGIKQKGPFAQVQARLWKDFVPEDFLYLYTSNLHLVDKSASHTFLHFFSLQCISVKC